MRSPNYDKYPATRTEGALFYGWEAIREALDRERKGPLAVDWYAGVHEEEITEGLLPGFSRIIRMRDLMKPEAEIRRMTDPFMTDDVLFGYVTNLRMPDFFDAEKLSAVRAELETAGEDVLILGPGAALVAPEHAVLARLGRDRRLFRDRRVRGVARLEGPEHGVGLLPRQPQHRLVRHRRQPLRQ